MFLLSVGFSRVPVRTDANRRLVGMWRMFRDPRILGIAGLIFFTGIVLILNATTFSPEAFVLRYMTALEDGRSRDAIGLISEDPDALTVIGGLSTNAELRPHDATVTGHEVVDGVTVIDATAVLDGEPVSLQFQLTDAPDWSPLTNWGFSVNPVAPIDVTTSGPTPIALGGTVGARYALVPSVVEVSAGSTWFDVPTTLVTADAIGSPVSVSVDVTASDALLTDIDSAVRKYLDNCAAQHTLVPAECPFAGFTFQKITTGPTWTIDSYPSIRISHTNGEWDVSGSGKVRLRVSLVDFATEKTEKYSELIPYTISATIADLDTAKPRLVLQNTVER